MQPIVQRLIAAACAAFVAPAAMAVEGNAELYGDFRYAVINFKAQGEKDDTDAASTNSHVGIRLTAAEGDYTATFVYERFLGNDGGPNLNTNPDEVRQGYLKVGTPFGSVLYGRAATAYKLSGQKLDPFFNTAVGTINGNAFSNSAQPVLGPSFGLSALAADTVRNGFIDNQIAYVSPEIFGVVVNAAVFLDERSRDNGERHDYGLGAEWNRDGFVAGVQYLDIRSTAANNAVANFNAGLPVPTKATRLYGGYKTETWGVSASWEPLDLKQGGLDRDYYFLAGWTRIAPNTSVAASYGYVEGTPFEGDSLSLGVFQTLMPGLEVYLAGRYTDRDAVRDNPGNSSRDVAVGVTYQFSLGRAINL